MPSVKIKGMSCGHCVASATQALQKLPGLTDVQVSLDKGEATWSDAPGQESTKKEIVINAIKAIGFDAE